MNAFAMISLAIQWASTIEAIFTTATSNASILTKLEQEAGPVGNLIKGLGAELFPSAAPELQTIGAIVAAFNPNYVKWLQGAINAAGYTPALAVDGSYGPKTIAGVQWVQKKLGITIDGIAGKVTEAALRTFVTKA